MLFFLQRDGDMMNPKDLDEQFCIIERRVKALAAENRELKARCADLEREIAEARGSVLLHKHRDEVAGQLRERIEKVLQSLETIGAGRTSEPDQSA